MKLTELPAWYSQQPTFASLAKESQRQYDYMFKRGLPYLLEYAENVEDVTVQHTDAVYRDINEDVHLHRAVSVCRIYRRGFNILQRYGVITTNPFARMELEGLAPRTVKWEPEEFKQYLQTCYRFSQPSMALLGMLCFFLCQRPGDMTNLKWTDLNAEFVNFVQSKTKKSMSLWMGTDLRHTLDKTPKQAEYIVIRGDGRPFSQRDYGREFEYLRYKAGIRDELQLRDLRRTGLTLLADGGATENQLKTVHGTNDSRVLSIYTLRTPKQSQDALVRLQHAGFSL